MAECSKDDETPDHDFPELPLKRDWCTSCSYCYTCSSFSKEVHSVLTASLSDDMMDLVEHRILCSIDVAYNVTTNMAVGTERAEDDTTNSTCSQDEDLIPRKLLKKRGYSSQVLMENWDYENMYPDLNAEAPCSYCYPCSFFSKEVHSYIHLKRISPPEFRKPLDIMLRRQLNVASDSFFGFLRFVKLGDRRFWSQSSRSLLNGTVVKSFAKLIYEVIMVTESSGKDSKGKQNSLKTSKMSNKIERKSQPTNRPLKATPSQRPTKTTGPAKPDTASGETPPKKTEPVKQVIKSPSTSSLPASKPNSQQKVKKSASSSSITLKKTTPLSKSRSTSSIQSRKSQSNSTQRLTSVTPKGRSSTSPLINPNVPSKPIRPNPKPFGVGRDEFRAFTYQEGVGSSNKKVLKSTSFVSDPGKPSQITEKRRNSLPPKPSKGLVSTGATKIRNKYGHVTSKTNSGIKKSASASKLSMNQKTLPENNVYQPKAVEMSVIKDSTVANPEKLKEMHDDLQDLCEKEQKLLRSLNSKSPYQELNIIQVYSPDIPVFYASLDRMTSPELVKSPIRDHDEVRESKSRSLEHEDQLVDDDEDVSTCRTPEMEPEEDISEKIHKCWSGECDHFTKTKNNQNVEEDEDHLEDDVISVRTPDLVEEQQTSERRESPQQGPGSPDKTSEPVTGSGGSSIYLDSVLTTIYSGEEYANRSSRSKSRDKREGSPVKMTYSSSSEEEEFIDSAGDKESVECHSGELNLKEELERSQKFEEALSRYHSNRNHEYDDSEIDRAVRKLDSMCEDRSDNAMSLEEYFRAFSPFYNQDDMCLGRSRDNSTCSPSSLKSEQHQKKQIKLRSPKVKKSSNAVTQKVSRTESTQSEDVRRGGSNDSFNEADLDEEIRRIVKKHQDQQEPESDEEPLSETLGRVEFVLDEITKMGTSIIRKTVSRQSEKSSLASISPPGTSKRKPRGSPQENHSKTGSKGREQNTIEEGTEDDRPDSTAFDASRLLLKVNQARDEVSKERTALENTIQQTHDMIESRDQVGDLQAQALVFPGPDDSLLMDWRRESFDLLREHEGALVKIMKYERKLDKLKSVLKGIVKKRSLIESRIQSRVSVRGIATPGNTTPIIGSTLSVHNIQEPALKHSASAIEPATKHAEKIVKHAGRDGKLPNTIPEKTPKRVPVKISELNVPGEVVKRVKDPKNIHISERSVFHQDSHNSRSHVTRHVIPPKLIGKTVNKDDNPTAKPVPTLPKPTKEKRSKKPKTDQVKEDRPSDKQSVQNLLKSSSAKHDADSIEILRSVREHQARAHTIHSATLKRSKLGSEPPAETVKQRHEVVQSPRVRDLLQQLPRYQGPRTPLPAPGTHQHSLRTDHQELEEVARLYHNVEYSETQLRERPSSGSSAVTIGSDSSGVMLDEDTRHPDRSCIVEKNSRYNTR